MPREKHDSLNPAYSFIQMDLFVKLEFESEEMQPVNRLNLNKNDCMLLHSVF